MISLWSIFWRTFAQLYVPFVLVAVGAAQIGDYRVTLTQLVVGTVVAGLGGLGAAYAAYQWGPALDAMRKALRSFIESILAGAATLTITTLADIAALPRLLWPVIVGSIGAAVLTFFQNQGPAPTPPATATQT